MGTDTVNQDQKKRTLEALERRFAVAKAELLHQHQQQQKSKKRAREDDEKLGRNANSSSIASVAHSFDASVTPYSKTPKIGNFSFSGYTKSKDVEANDPTYTKLCHPIHVNLLITDVKIFGKSTDDNVLHELLQNGDSAQKYMQGSRSTKIDNWLLLDNFVRGHGACVRALQCHSKSSKIHMSMKQHKRCGSFELPPELQKFENFKPMHEIWKGYIMQLLQNVGKKQLAHCLLNADLHGANILVVNCKIAVFTGVSGIMIRETGETFGIITEENKFRVVPKKFSVFMLRADYWEITLHGDKLTSRNLSNTT